MVLGLGTAAAAQAPADSDAGESLRSVERRLDSNRARRGEMERELRSGRQEEKAAKAGKQATAEALARLRRQLRAAVGELHAVEARLSALEAELAALDEQQARKRAAFETRHQQRGKVLNAILRIAMVPPEAMVALNGPPLRTVRGIMVFRTLEPGLRGQAERMRGDLAELAAVRAEKLRTRTELIEAKATLGAKEDALDRLRHAKAAIYARANQDHQALREANASLAAEIARQAKDINELIKLWQERKARPPPAAKPTVRKAGPAAPAMPRPPDIHDFTGEKGSLRPPVQGRIVRLYGAKGEFGAASRGIVIESRPAAQVVAPYDGVVVFAGPFRGYGEILLIDHGGGYHTLLAGLGRIYSVPGQWLFADEPVAVMADTGSVRPRLYVEFRRNGQPINPLPWLAAGESRVSG